MAHIVVTLQSNAYTSLCFLDMFECAAAAGNVGHTCSVILSDAGISALSMEPARFNERAHDKNTGKMISSLPLYDVEDIFVHSQSFNTTTYQSHQLADVFTVVDELPVFDASVIHINF